MKEVRPGSVPRDQGSARAICSDPMLGHQRMWPLILKGSVWGGPPASGSSEGQRQAVWGSSFPALAGRLSQEGGEGIGLLLLLFPTRTISGNSCFGGYREPTSCFITIPRAFERKDLHGGPKLSKVESG